VALQVNSSNFSPAAFKPSIGSDVAFASQRGNVARTGQTSLNVALASINGTISSAENSGEKLGPVDLKMRIESLIDEQISSGVLNDKQAAVLRAYFGTGVAPPEVTDEVPPPPPPPPPAIASEAMNQTARPEKRPEVPYPGARPDTKDPLDPIAVFIQKLRNESPTGFNGYNSLSGASTARRDPVLLDINA